jgi:hypothetical protein
MPSSYAPQRSRSLHMIRLHEWLLIMTVRRCPRHAPRSSNLGGLNTNQAELRRFELKPRSSAAAKCSNRTSQQRPWCASRDLGQAGNDRSWLRRPEFATRRTRLHDWLQTWGPSWTWRTGPTLDT